MAKLSSAIVQRKLATLRDVEEALARQVLYGGDLATNLLEQAPHMDERALTLLLAETQELPPAPAGQLPHGSSDALALVPGDVALRHGVYPLEKTGSSLVVAVSEPMKPDVEQDLAFGLGVNIVQRVAPLVRVKQAICRDYGLPLDRRSHRVLAKLEGKPDPSPSLTPAPLVGAPDFASLPRPPSIPPLGLPTDLGSFGALQKSAIPALRPLPQVTINEPEADTPAPSRSGASIYERLTSPAPPEAAGGGAAPTPTLRAESGAVPLPPVWIQPQAPPASSGERRPSYSSRPPPSAGPEPRRASVSGQKSVHRTDLGAWSVENKQAERRPRGRHRGPYTAAAAEEDLLNADSRDAVLTALFDYACQYFEYSALFAVHGDLAEGRSANGPGADHEKITGIGVALDMPGALATARKEGHFSIQALAKDGLDAQLARDLERKRGKKVLLLPILVRGRCVLIFYGDDGDEDVDLSRVGDVLAFAPLVASALEGVIRKKKASLRQGAAMPREASIGPVPRSRAVIPTREERREALAAALESTLRRASSRPPPARTSRPPPVPARGRSTPPAAPDSMRHSQNAREAAAETDETAAETPRRPEPERERRSEDEQDRPITEPAIPAARAAASMSPSESDDATRSPTPSQGTPALRSVRPGGTPDAVLEGNGAARAQAPAKASDDAPEISVGAAEVDWSPELGAASDLGPDDNLGAHAEDAGAAEDAELDDIAASQPPGPPASTNRGPPSLPDSQVVVPATRPLKAHSSAELRLPSIIVNVEHDIEGLVTRLLAGDDKVLDRLAALGASAASYLVARFPGPIREADRFATGERASQRGPILRALVRIGLPAAPFLAVRSNDRDASVRTWATQLLGEIPSVDAALAVSRRVADSSAEVRRAALEAGRLLQSDDDARVTLRDKVLSLAESTSSIESRVAAIEAIAHFRDGRATPRLVRLLDSRDEVGQSAEWALGVLTRQAFGRDTTAWDTWWREKGGAHRIEWLIDSLMHEDAEIRRAAGEELKSLTKEYFGYYDDLPKAERAKAQKRYTEWWETTGKSKFPK